MPFVLGKSDGPLEFDKVFACLERHCPGTQLLDGDYCTSRVAKLVAIYQKLGEPTANPVIAGTLAAVHRLGRTRQIRVPVEQGELVGTVNQGGLMLSTQAPISRGALDPVVKALAEFDNLHVQIGGLAPIVFPRIAALPRRILPWWQFWK